MKLYFHLSFSMLIFRRGGERVKMQCRDLLEQAYQLLDGMKSMCQLLECPEVPPITGNTLVIFECVYGE